VGQTTLIGVPYDASSSFLHGAAGGPPLVRQALRSSSANNWSETLVDAIGPEALRDAGDLALPPTAEARSLIERAIHTLASARDPFIAIGGDHSITYPIVRGAAPSYPDLTILHFDAHPDLYDQFEGDRFSHACPFARIMEEKLAARLVQVGIRTMTAHQREQAQRFGVEQIDMRAWARGERPKVAGAVYLSLDLDGLDPAFAPGVSHREPGGLSVREVLTVIDGLVPPQAHLIGADIVEFNPKQDVSGLTAFVAAKFAKELAARMNQASPNRGSA
jgi:agmatinase